MLEQRLDEERALREQRRKERDEQHLYLSLAVITDDTFKNYQGFDMATWESDPSQDPAAAKPYRILRSTTISDFTEKVAEDLGRDADCVRLWAMVNRQNQTVRPDQVLKQQEMTINDACIRHGTKNTDFRLWAEVAERDSDGKPKWPDTQASISPNQPIVIFLKYFDQQKQTLKGAGHIYISKRAKVSELLGPILELMEWPEDTSLDLYEVGLILR